MNHLLSGQYDEPEFYCDECGELFDPGNDYDPPTTCEECQQGKCELCGTVSHRDDLDYLDCGKWDSHKVCEECRDRHERLLKDWLDEMTSEFNERFVENEGQGV